MAMKNFAQWWCAPFHASSAGDEFVSVGFQRAGALHYAAAGARKRTAITINLFRSR
jgi:hypothetical protein